MPTTKIKGGQVLFEVSASLADTNYNVLTTDVANPEGIKATSSGVVKCTGQLPFLNIEIALAAGSDDLTDFLIQVQSTSGGAWNDVQATAGDPAETLVAGATVSIAINLLNPWAVRFRAKKAAHSTTQVLTVRGLMSSSGIPVDW